jgi:hypothetical protein
MFSFSTHLRKIKILSFYAQQVKHFALLSPQKTFVNVFSYKKPREEEEE